MPRQFRLSFCVVFTLLAALYLSGRVDSAAAQPPGAAATQLGELSFPNSGGEQVQARFLTGVKLLHNFEYDEALEAFRACQRAEPTFAMAYWGQAMCYNHPLWGEQDLAAARGVIQRLDAAGGEFSPREEGWLSALRVLYGEGAKSARDRDYAAKMADLARRYPDDHEAACFYALALLGTRAGERDTRVYMQAAGILEEVYRHNPRHPGVLHYLIHCYDDPLHAPLGLRAARTYGAIAANSAHARHMPSHIYLPLGMWDEVIQSNDQAWQAGLGRLARFQPEKAQYDIHALHALQWLQYGYLQKADYVRARQLLNEMANIQRRQPAPMSKWYLAFMYAAYVVDAPDWQEVEMDVDMQGVELSARASRLFAGGLAAIRRDTTGAERILQQIRALRSRAERQIEDVAHHHHTSYFEGVYSASIRAVRIVETQLEALILLADGQRQAALARLRDAAAAEQRLTPGYGPPLPVQPSHELLAQVLLNLGRAREAQQHFQQALERHPRRTASLAGLAAAARRAGDAETARRAEEDLARTLGPDVTPFPAWQQLPFAE